MSEPLPDFTVQAIEIVNGVAGDVVGRCSTSEAGVQIACAWYIARQTASPTTSIQVVVNDGGTIIASIGKER